MTIFSNITHSVRKHIQDRIIELFEKFSKITFVYFSYAIKYKNVFEIVWCNNNF